MRAPVWQCRGGELLARFRDAYLRDRPGDGRGSSPSFASDRPTWTGRARSRPRGCAATRRAVCAREPALRARRRRAGPRLHTARWPRAPAAPPARRPSSRARSGRARARELSVRRRRRRVGGACASVPRAARGPRARSSTASRATTARARARRRFFYVTMQVPDPAPRARRGAGRRRAGMRPRSALPEGISPASDLAARLWEGGLARRDGALPAGGDRASRARAARAGFVRKMAAAGAERLAAVVGSLRRDGARPTCPRPSPTSRRRRGVRARRGAEQSARRAHARARRGRSRAWTTRRGRRRPLPARARARRPGWGVCFVVMTYGTRKNAEAARLRVEELAREHPAGESLVVDLVVLWNTSPAQTRSPPLDFLGGGFAARDPRARLVVAPTNDLLNRFNAEPRAPARRVRRAARRRRRAAVARRARRAPRGLLEHGGARAASRRARASRRAAKSAAAARRCASPRTSTARAARFATRARSRAAAARARRLEEPRQSALPPRARRAVPRTARAHGRLHDFVRAHRTRPDDFAFGAFAAWAARRPALVVPPNASEARPLTTTRRRIASESARAAPRPEQTICAAARDGARARARAAAAMPRARGRARASAVARAAVDPPRASPPRRRLNMAGAPGWNYHRDPRGDRRRVVRPRGGFPAIEMNGAERESSRRAGWARAREQHGRDAGDRPMGFEARCPDRFRGGPSPILHHAARRSSRRRSSLRKMEPEAIAGSWRRHARRRSRRCSAWRRRPRRTRLHQAGSTAVSDPSTGNARAPDWRDQARRPR